ncbi:hypothetical protein ZIOFF_012453 [Zingiber officinale]|uniref:Uncharacterized protein n=1 Tax=Zingiber officinale TaxID=94328 RepID=A0A8J5I9V9_ZINOF|nr:hypothetical protein ZIOFF_012453 [Zingiber officinale]
MPNASTSLRHITILAFFPLRSRPLLPRSLAIGLIPSALDLHQVRSITISLLPSLLSSISRSLGRKSIRASDF